MSAATLNPDFAIICAFFERFSDLCGVEPVDTKQLIAWLENTDEVHPDLADLHMKLLRKLRKTVHATKWEKAVTKFCYMCTSIQDAWEIERFGYKKSSLAVKLRVLKALLEGQFDANLKFKNAINGTTAGDLRGTPIGKDDHGNNYWYFLDDKCNLFIYQENSDDETWRLVASNREELVHLIQRLKDRVPVIPDPIDDVIDEDSCSNSDPAKPLVQTPDTFETENHESKSEIESAIIKIEKDEEIIEPPVKKVESLKITLKNPNKIVSSEKQESPIKEVTTNNHQSSLKITISTKGKKMISRKVEEKESQSEPVKEPTPVKEMSPPAPVQTKKTYRGRLAHAVAAPEQPETKPPEVLAPPAVTQKATKQTKQAAKAPAKRGRGGKRPRRTGRNAPKHDSDSDVVGEAIEDPILHVQGEGSGEDNQGVPFECSEIIEEHVMHFHGEGSGQECLVGNTDSKPKEIPKQTTTSGQTFFFGAPGCLKNSPAGTVTTGSLFGFGAGASTTETEPEQDIEPVILSTNNKNNEPESSENLASPSLVTTPNRAFLNKIDIALSSTESATLSYTSSPTSFINRLDNAIDSELEDSPCIGKSIVEPPSVVSKDSSTLGITPLKAGPDLVSIRKVTEDDSMEEKPQVLSENNLTKVTSNETTSNNQIDSSIKTSTTISVLASASPNRTPTISNTSPLSKFTPKRPINDLPCAQMNTKNFEDIIDNDEEIELETETSIVKSLLNDSDHEIQQISATSVQTMTETIENSRLKVLETHKSLIAIEKSAEIDLETRTEEISLHKEEEKIPTADFEIETDENLVQKVSTSEGTIEKIESSLEKPNSPPEATFDDENETNQLAQSQSSGLESGEIESSITGYLGSQSSDKSSVLGIVEKHESGSVSSQEDAMMNTEQVVKCQESSCIYEIPIVTEKMTEDDQSSSSQENVMEISEEVESNQDDAPSETLKLTVETVDESCTSTEMDEKEPEQIEELVQPKVAIEILEDPVPTITTNTKVISESSQKQHTETSTELKQESEQVSTVQEIEEPIQQEQIIDCELDCKIMETSPNMNVENSPVEKKLSAISMVSESGSFNSITISIQSSQELNSTQISSVSSDFNQTPCSIQVIPSDSDAATYLSESTSNYKEDDEQLLSQNSLTQSTKSASQGNRSDLEVFQADQPVVLSQKSEIESSQSTEVVSDTSDTVELIEQRSQSDEGQSSQEIPYQDIPEIPCSQTTSEGEDRYELSQEVNDREEDQTNSQDDQERIMPQDIRKKEKSANVNEQTVKEEQKENPSVEIEESNPLEVKLQEPTTEHVSEEMENAAKIEESQQTDPDVLEEQNPIDEQPLEHEIQELPIVGQCTDESITNQQVIEINDTLMEKVQTLQASEPSSTAVIDMRTEESSIIESAEIENMNPMTPVESQTSVDAEDPEQQEVETEHQSIQDTVKPTLEEPTTPIESQPSPEDVEPKPSIENTEPQSMIPDIVPQPSIESIEVPKEQGGESILNEPEDQSIPAIAKPSEEPKATESLNDQNLSDTEFMHLYDTVEPVSEAISVSLKPDSGMIATGNLDESNAISLESKNLVQKTVTEMSDVSDEKPVESENVPETIVACQPAPLKVISNEIPEKLKIENLEVPDEKNDENLFEELSSDEMEIVEINEPEEPSEEESVTLVPETSVSTADLKKEPHNVDLEPTVSVTEQHSDTSNDLVQESSTSENQKPVELEGKIEVENSFARVEDNNVPKIPDSTKMVYNEMAKLNKTSPEDPSIPSPLNVSSESQSPDMKLTSAIEKDIQVLSSPIVKICDQASSTVVGTEIKSVVGEPLEIESKKDEIHRKFVPESSEAKFENKNTLEVQKIPENLCSSKIYPEDENDEQSSKVDQTQVTSKQDDLEEPEAVPDNAVSEMLVPEIEASAIEITPNNSETSRSSQDLIETTDKEAVVEGLVEYKGKKQRASERAKEKSLFRPQFDVIQTDVVPIKDSISLPSDSNKSIPVIENDSVDQMSTKEPSPLKEKSPEQLLDLTIPSTISTLEKSVERVSSEESNSQATNEPLDRPFIPFEESQNANDALYSSTSTESLKAEVTEDVAVKRQTDKVSRSKTSFNDFSVSKLIGKSPPSELSITIDPQTTSSTTHVNSSTVETTESIDETIKTLKTVEPVRSTPSPVKHSIESIVAKSSRSSPAKDLESTGVIEDSKPIEVEQVRSTRVRGRGRRRPSAEPTKQAVDSVTPNSESKQDVTVEPPPQKKSQIEEPVKSVEIGERSVSPEEVTFRGNRTRNRRKATTAQPSVPEIDQSSIVVTVSSKDNKPSTLETTEVLAEVATKKPRKSLTPEKALQQPVAEPEPSNSEKLVPKLRAKALAKKSKTEEASEAPPNKIDPVLELVTAKESIPEQKAVPDVEVIPVSTTRATRSRNKRLAEPLTETQTAKEVKVSPVVSPVEVGSKKLTKKQELARKKALQKEEPVDTEAVVEEKELVKDDPVKQEVPKKASAQKKGGGKRKSDPVIEEPASAKIEETVKVQPPSKVTGRSRKRRMTEEGAQPTSESDGEVPAVEDQRSVAVTSPTEAGTKRLTRKQELAERKTMATRKSSEKEVLQVEEPPKKPINARKKSVEPVKPEIPEAESTEIQEIKKVDETANKQGPLKPTSRSRKRRMSEEEESRRRQTSESDNDFFDQAAAFDPTPGQHDQPTTSEGQLLAPAGGKRAKIRGKQIDVTLRKEVELRKHAEIATTSSASEDDHGPRTRAGRATRRNPVVTTQNVTVTISPIAKKMESKHIGQLQKPVAEKSGAEDLRNSISPLLSPAESDPLQIEAAATDAPEEQLDSKSVQRDRKGKRRVEAVEKAPVATRGTRTRRVASPIEEVPKKSTAENDTPVSTSPVVKSPDMKKAKIEDPESEDQKAVEAPVETKKRGGRPRKADPKTPPEADPKKRVVHLSREIDISNVLQSTEEDVPVRQSRRIAQLKIREEAERRKTEEILLAQMKADSEKKKRQDSKDIDFVPKGLRASSESDNEDSNISGRKRRKKKNDKKPWLNTSESSSEEPEEEEEHEHSDPDIRHSALKSDHEFSCESEDEDGQVVPTKRARTVKKEDQSDDEDYNPDHACQKCKKTDHPEWILLCDDCDKGYHCSCLKPVLFLIPEGDWFCPDCQHAKLIEVLEQKLCDFDFATKQFELAEINRQREEKIAAEEQAAQKVEQERVEAEQKLKDEAKPKKKVYRESSSTNSSNSNSSSETDSDDDKPLYKLRRRNQTSITTRIIEYDDMINRAIKRDMIEVEEANQGMGNAGRGKDISTIIEADKEEKRRKSQGLEEGEVLEKEEGEKLRKRKKL